MSGPSHDEDLASHSANSESVAANAPGIKVEPADTTSRKATFAQAARVVAAFQLSRQTKKPSNVDIQRVLHSSTEQQDYGPSLIIPRLYLGDFFNATDEETIERLGITHILSALESEPTMVPSQVGGRKIQKLHVLLTDIPRSNISRHFESTNKWIADALNDPTSVVLVHCQMGISRSATLVAAYLLSVTSDYSSASEVLDFLKTRRSYIQPNSGFRRQLENHAMSCLRLRTTPGNSEALNTRAAEMVGDTVIVQIDTVETDKIS